MENVIIAAGGDVSTGFDPPEQTFASVSEVLRSADLRFAQCERTYSNRGSFQEQGGSRSRRQQHGETGGQRPQMAAVFKDGPFDIVSLASNHTGDWGPEAAEDTVETFRLLGIATIGAGRNIAEARKPAIVVRKGLRIAFLGYVSTTLPQYWATETRAGSAPMRAHTYYEAYEFQPGAPARIVTVPHAADLEHLVEDVSGARKAADIVFVSMHWGVHYTARPCDYQSVVAHTAIDAGASAIIGHHPHQMQGIEIYKGSVIFYSIGNFAFYRNPTRNKKEKLFCAPAGEYVIQDVYSLEPDPGIVPEYNRHWNESAIAFFHIDRLGLHRVTCLPILLNEIGRPEIVASDQPQFQKSLDYLNWAGKFIAGGLRQITAADGRYQVFSRNNV